MLVLTLVYPGPAEKLKFGENETLQPVAGMNRQEDRENIRNSASTRIFFIRQYSTTSMRIISPYFSCATAIKFFQGVRVTINEKLRKLSKHVNHNVRQHADGNRYKVYVGELKARYMDQRGLCPYCASQLDTNCMTVDHVHPLSHGGKNTIENIVLACFCCNNYKDNMIVTEFLVKRIIFVYLVLLRHYRYSGPEFDSLFYKLPNNKFSLADLVINYGKIGEFT